MPKEICPPITGYGTGQAGSQGTGVLPICFRLAGSVYEPDFAPPRLSRYRTPYRGFRFNLRAAAARLVRRQLTASPVLFGRSAN